MVAHGTGGTRRRCRCAVVLREWRQELGMTQADFAREAFGLGQATYAAWETSTDNAWLQQRLQCSRDSRRPGAPGAHPYYYEQLAGTLRKLTAQRERFQTYCVAQELGIPHEFDPEIPDGLEEQFLEAENSVAMNESVYPVLSDQVGFAIIHPESLKFVVTGELRVAERSRPLGQIVLSGVPLERNTVFVTVISDDRLTGSLHPLVRGTLVAVDTRDVALQEGSVYLCRYGRAFEFGIAVLDGGKWYSVSSHWNQRRYPPRRLGRRATVLGRVRTLAEVMNHLLDPGAGS